MHYENAINQHIRKLEESGIKKLGFFARLCLWHEYLDSKYNRWKYENKTKRLKRKLDEAESLYCGFLFLEEHSKAEIDFFAKNEK